MTQQFSTYYSMLETLAVEAEFPRCYTLQVVTWYRIHFPLNDAIISMTHKGQGERNFPPLNNQDDGYNAYQIRICRPASPRICPRQSHQHDCTGRTALTLRLVHNSRSKYYHRCGLHYYVLYNLIMMITLSLSIFPPLSSILSLQSSISLPASKPSSNSAAVHSDIFVHAAVIHFYQFFKRSIVLN